VSFEVMPHRVIRSGSLNWGAWTSQLGQGEVTPLESAMDGWDYSASIQLTTSLRYDRAGVCSDLAVADVSALALQLTVDCAATRGQWSAQTRLAAADGEGRVTVSLHLPAGSVADRISLIRSVVACNEHWEPAIPAGSWLARDVAKRVRVEGDGGRFPIEAMSFSGRRYEGAPWRFDLDYTDLDDPMVAAFVLYVNTDHEASATLLAQKAKTTPALRVMVESDYFETFLDDIARRPELDPPTNPDPESVWAVLDGQCQLRFKRDLGSMLAIWRESPIEGRSIVRGKLKYLTGLSS
jgi:hypothetical protein